MEFHNMKLKRKVDVPESQIKKTVFQQKGSRGAHHRRYALTAEQDGVRMFKFISEATFKFRTLDIDSDVEIQSLRFVSIDRRGICR